MTLTLRFRRGRMLVAGTLLTLALVNPVIAAAEPGFRSDRFAAIAIEPESGKTLFAREADALRRPASLAKVMTLYIAFDEIRGGRLDLSDRIMVSRHASAQPPTKVGLRAGSKLTVREAIDLIAVKSANDAAVALAEHISGSEAAFARRMTREARKLGMRSTRFTNASGLPDRSQRSTARDLARLAQAFIDRHPDGYEVFDKTHTRFRGRHLGGHNRLLTSPGVDGIKTGYTRASGFSLMSSGVRDGRRVIAVVLGGDTAAVRDRYMRKLLGRSFAELSSETAAVELAGSRKVGSSAELNAGSLWWVQVGAFVEREDAWTHLDELTRRHPDQLGQAPRGVDRPGSLYQARFNVFSETAARETCRILEGEGEACFWFGAPDRS